MSTPKRPSTQGEGPTIAVGPLLCPGSGEWAGWGWSWYPCPECHARIDVDPDTLAIKPHSKIENGGGARRAAAAILQYGE
jgi:hypothetical protein